MRNPIQVTLVVLAILAAGLPGTGATQENQLAIEIMALSHVYDTTCVAVEVPVEANQTVSGLMWYNNDEETVFPKLVAAAANPGMPPNLEDALVIVDNVTGAEDGWSELQFPQPIASPTGMFYVIFQFPAFTEAEGRGVGPGLGYEVTTATNAVYLTGDGEEWFKMITAQRLLVEPIYDEAAGEKNSAGKGVLMLPQPSEMEIESQQQAEDIVRVTQLLRPYPNPFNPAVKFEFALKDPGKVRLSIYDICGRLVQDLVNESLPSGRYERTWQGKDRSGRRMASGVYFARMTADSQCWTHRMVLVK